MKKSVFYKFWRTARLLFAATGMVARDVIVQLIAALAGVSAVAARVDKRAREVNVLHVFAQVGAIRANLAANGAAVSSGMATSLLWQLLDKTIQLAVSF